MSGTSNDSMGGGAARRLAYVRTHAKLPCHANSARSVSPVSQFSLQSGGISRNVNVTLASVNYAALTDERAYS